MEELQDLLSDFAHSGEKNTVNQQRSDLSMTFLPFFISVNNKPEAVAVGDVSPSFSSLPGSTGDEYHLVHVSVDELSDNSSATPSPTVITRKRDSPTRSNGCRESEDSLTGSPGTRASPSLRRFMGSGSVYTLKYCCCRMLLFSSYLDALIVI